MCSNENPVQPKKKFYRAGWQGWGENWNLSPTQSHNHELETGPSSQHFYALTTYTPMNNTKYFYELLKFTRTLSYCMCHSATNVWGDHH